MTPARVTCNDILTGMARPHITDPDVLKRETKHPYWYIRPVIPGVGQRSIKLGDCSVMTKTRAKLLGNKICNQFNLGQFYEQTQISIDQLLDRYIKTHVPSLSPNTRPNYVSTIETHIRPAFGGLRLCELSGELVQDWCNGIQRSAGTIRRAVSILSSIWDRAEAWGYAEGRNPCKGIRIQSEIPARKLRSLEAHELAALFAAAEEPLLTQMQIATFCGPRAGEIRGLKYEDFRPPLLRIERTFSLQRDPRTKFWAVKPPKNGWARELPLATWLAEKVGTGTGYLWPDQDYLSMQRALKEIAVALGFDFKGFGWHTLRSSFATLMDQQGAERVQETLGHAAARTTDIYIRPHVARELAAGERVRAMILEAGAGPGSEEVQ